MTTTTVQNVIAEHIGNDAWLVMWADGTVREFISQKSAEIAIRKSVKAESAEIVITQIEWRHGD